MSEEINQLCNKLLEKLKEKRKPVKEELSTMPEHIMTPEETNRKNYLQGKLEGMSELATTIGVIRRKMRKEASNKNET